MLSCNFSQKQRWAYLHYYSWLLIAAFQYLSGCAASLPDTVVVELPVSVTISVDGGSQTVESQADTVRQLLDESDVKVGDLDLVDPPLYSPLANEMVIVITRMEESLESIERAIPFERRIVRNEAMSASDDPVIIQEGDNGLEELTVQIVYRDGIEVERRVVQSTILAEAREEIVMIGLDITASADVVRFGGILAFVNGGRVQFFRGSNLFPEELSVEGVLDSRVFALSPDGQFLLYSTLDDSDPARFNRLYLAETSATKSSIDLNIGNVLWADWNPMAESPLQIAYSTGEATATAPGWEANNDLWTVNISGTMIISDSKRSLVEGYPATFGWWGGNYAWSPSGKAIGYSYADEVGVLSIPEESPFFQDEIDPDTAFDSEAEESGLDESRDSAQGEAVDAEDEEETGAEDVIRRKLVTFTEYDTRSDWVWVPPLSWSADGRFLAFTRHASDQTIEDRFDTQLVDINTGLIGSITQDVGIWSNPIFSSDMVGMTETGPQIAYLKSKNTRDSLSSSYTLWLMDRDGSNKRELFPPPGITSRFPRESRSMVWNSSSSGDMIFVFDGDLYWFDLDGQVVSQLTNDEPDAALPSWAPYGFASLSDSGQ